MKRTIMAVMVCLLLVSCAPRPESIKASFISHEKFRTIAFFSKITMKDIMIEKIKEVVAEYEKEQKKVVQSK